MRSCDGGEAVSYFQLYLCLPDRGPILNALRKRGIIVTSNGPYANFRDPEGRTIKLSEPVTGWRIGDRVLLTPAIDTSTRPQSESTTEQHTIAGGIVLDADGHKESLTSSIAPDDVGPLVRATIVRHRFAHRKNLLSKSRFSSDEISGALIRLQRNGEIVLRQQVAADVSSYPIVRDRIRIKSGGQSCRFRKLYTSVSMV